MHGQRVTSISQSRARRILALPVIGALIGPTLWSQEARGQDGPEAALSTAFTYQGQLRQSGAVPPGTVNFDFQFTLWDAAGSGSPPTGGVQIGGLQLTSNVAVTDGLFTVQLNSGNEFGASAFTGDARWLQLAVRPSSPPGGTFTILAPRQPLTAAPYALFSNATRGIAVDAVGNVGIGTTSPATKLDIDLGGAGYVRFGSSFDMEFSGGSDGLFKLINTTAAGRTSISGPVGVELLSVLNTSGNVGVGTTAPASKLDVAGNLTLADTGPLGIAFRGNGETTADTGIGHPADGVITLRTNAGEVLRANAAGNVGIGTTTPTQKLDVNGDIALNGQRLFDLSGSTLIMGDVIDLDGPVPNLTFRTNNGDRMTISGSNVGIGTTAPENTLHVFKGSAGTVTADASAALVVENSSNAYINLLTPNAQENGILFGKTSNPVAGGIIYNAPGDLDGFQFRVNGNSTKMVLDAVGSLGIDRASQNDGTHTMGALRFGGAGSGEAIASKRTPGGNQFGIDFYTGSTNRLAITGAGNVGIGTASPDRPLKVLTSGQSTIGAESSNTGGTWAELKNTSTGGKSWNLISTGSANSEGAGDLLIHVQGITPAIVESGNPASNCLVLHAGTGCDTAGCQSVVCALDPFCCTNSWDSQCASEAAEACGGTVTAGLGLGTPDPVAKLQVSGGAIMPSASKFGGIRFPSDPGGGTGDTAFIRYYFQSGEDTTLEIGNNNDANDDISFIQNSLVRMSIASGNVNVVGMLSKGGGTFKIDHPLDPENKYLYHSFVESPDMMNIYNGVVTTDAAGFAWVEMPEWFEALNRDFRYQLTVIGQFAQAIVADEIAGNRFRIQTDEPNVKVSWQVTGVRKDPFAEQNRVQVEVEKPAAERGYYLHPEAYGESMELGVYDAPRLERSATTGETDQR